VPVLTETVRLFFTVGYLGDSFHGSQIQPDVVTVQGELIRALTSLGWLDSAHIDRYLVLSSRTDAGVHVRLNGGIVDIDAALWESLTPRKFVRAIDDRLRGDLCLLTVQEVEDDWNPRLADYRVYRYRLEGMEFWQEPPLHQFEEWLKLFVGTKNVSNFARVEPGKNPIRTVRSANPWTDNGRLIGFEIVGDSFLWNQVRRIANALFRLSVGEITVESIHDAFLHPEIEIDFGVAPPEWLVLWGVSWERFPLPPSTSRVHFSAPPMGRQAERTRKSRWQKSAQYELKSLLYHEWATLGILPNAYHSVDDEVE